MLTDPYTNPRNCPAPAGAHPAPTMAYQLVKPTCELPRCQPAALAGEGGDEFGDDLFFAGHDAPHSETVFISER